MANRYWVGGTASWDGTAGTKWASTSGGAGGQSVPTSADDVFFDGASGAVGCTIVFGNTGAKSITCSGFTGTLGGSASITVSGSVTLVAGMTFTYAGAFTINATGTLTTAGKTIGSLTINSGAVVTLGDALTLSTSILVNYGTFTTNNYNVTATVLQTAITDIQTLNFGSSTLSFSGPSLSINFASAATLTLNAGTSQINLTDTAAQLIGANKTFYNVTFTNSTAGGSVSITGSNTFQNLTFTASSTGDRNLSISSGTTQTVNGTLNCSGVSAIGRSVVRSGTLGTSVTLTVNTLSATDCDFRDITIAGAAAGSSPTRAGNLQGNSGINFPASKNVYWNLAGTQDWNATAWATTSGGTPAINNFPLAQDTAIFDDAGAADTVSFGSVQYNLPSINASGRTSAMTLNHTVQRWYGSSFTLGSGVTVTGGSTSFIFSRPTLNITTAGKTLSFGINIQPLTGTVNFLDAYTSTGPALTLTSGTLNAGSYNVTLTGFGSSSSLTRTLNLGSGLWTLTSAGTTWNITSTTNLTFIKGTANILFTNSSFFIRLFNGGNGLSYNKFTTGGTGNNTTRIITNNTFTELSSIKTDAHTWEFTASTTTTVGAWSIAGTAGNVVTIKSTINGLPHNLVKTGGGFVSSDYLSIRDSSASPSNTWYAGANSTNVANNSGWIFPSVPSASFFILF